MSLRWADPLASLSIWAPNLKFLDLQACYSLEELVFPDTHSLASELPASHTPTDFEVNIENANLSAEAMAALDANPRVLDVLDPEPDTTNPMAAMQAMFRQMHAGRGGGGGGGGMA